LFDSFDLLTEIKTISLKQRNNEMNKYSTLLKETETKEQSIKTVNEKINELNRVIKNNEEKISSILAKFKKKSKIMKKK
jgi:hypothetical protein